MITAPCLPDDMILALAGGALAAQALEAAQAHLDGCPKCRRVLVAVSRGITGGGSTGRLSGADPEPVELPVGNGTHVGRYMVKGVLGAGGMGVVYAAHDPELERSVAIKLVHERHPRPDALLRREAIAMARLLHPNVVQVYDAGAHGGRTYIAMELVGGRTLRSWLKARRPWPAIVAAFVEAGRGLSAAHEAGLLHGDFKPDNVFVAADGRVKVGDFGLARPATAAGAPRPAAPDPWTSSEGTCGTPAYLAPEVMAGSPPSVASDQFSFCVALWEALYGQRPFPGGAAAAAFQAARPPQPSGSRRVPSWLRRAVLRGLAADPAARHPSMAALLRELARERRRLRLPAAVAFAAAAAAAVVALGPGGPAWARGPGGGAGTRDHPRADAANLLAARAEAVPEVLQLLAGREADDAARRELTDCRRALASHRGLDPSADVR